MKTKITISIVIIIFLGIIGLIYFDQNTLQSKPTPEVQSNNNEQVDGEDDDEVEKDEEIQHDETQEEQSIAEDIKDTVRKVVVNALSIFVKDDLKIVAIGDSLTQGVGDSTDNGGYVSILENTFNDAEQSVEVENYGKRGNRSDQLLERLDQEEITESIKEADIVLITIGANDIMKVVKNNFTNLRFEPFAEEKVYYTERLRKIFDKITDLNSDAAIYLIGLYNPFEKYFGDIEQLNQIMASWNAAGQLVANEYDNLDFIPIDDAFRTSNQNLFSDDNFHPNVDGYHLIAKRVLESIRPSLEEAKIETEEPSEQIEER